MANPRLILLSQDLFDLGYCIDIPDIIERKTFKRDLVFTNSFDFTCKNVDNFFSASNPSSIFSNNAWLYASIKYYNSDNILIWDGIVTNIRCDHRDKTAVIESTDKLYQFREKYISYTSADWETPATALYNIFVQEGFTAYDNTSLQKSITTLTTNAVYIKCNINKSDNMTITGAIDNLSIYACADAFMHFGIVYFKTWTQFAGGTSISINNNKTNRMKSAPIVNYLETDLINQYSINYNGGSSPLTDSANLATVSRTKYGTKSLEEFRSGTGKQFIVKDTISAKWIGEQYIKRTHANLSTNPRPLISVQFDMDFNFRNYINLETYFKLTLTDESWTDKIFEVFEYRFNENQRNINIYAVEVAS